MSTHRLTNKFVANAKPPEHGRQTFWDSAIGDDTSLPGSFGLRVTERGVKSWVAMYRVEDLRNPTKRKQRFQTLGSYPSLPLAEAREMARDALKAAGRGIDPIEAKKEARQEAASIKTVGGAVEEFIERHAKRHNRGWREVERVFRVYVLPAWEERPLPSINPADVHEILDTLVDGGHPYMANRVLAHVRRFFNWCKERHWLTDAPTDAIKKPAKEVARDRVLSKDEVRRFWEGCEQLGWPFGPCFRLLLVTGQRRDEAAHMRWNHLDLETRLWTLPRQETKSDRLHEVPLSGLAMEIIEGLPRHGEYVFTTTGTTPISGFSKVKARLDVLSEVADWRLHDLRRTAASLMAEIGIAPHVIDKVQNRATGAISGVTAIYNRHSYRREKEDALSAYCRALGNILSGEEPNVVPLRRGADV